MDKIDFCIAYHSLIERSKTGNWTSPTTHWYQHRRSLGKAASCSFPDPEGLVLVKQQSCQSGVSVWLPTISSHRPHRWQQNATNVRKGLPF